MGTAIRILALVLATAVVGCGGRVSESLALCPDAHLGAATESAASHIGLDYVIDCEAPDAVHVVLDGSVTMGTGQCAKDPAAICVAPCSVPGECGMAGRVETAMVAAGL